MKNLFFKTLAIGLILLALPLKQQAQQPAPSFNVSTIDVDITEIDLFDERVFFIYNLLNDSRFNVVPGEQDGVFIVSADPAYENLDLTSTFDDFRQQTSLSFSKMDKEQASETALECKALLPKEFVMSLMMDIYVQSRQNNLCANADPFCTDNGLYQFPAGVNAGSGEPGPSYNCLNTTPNPAWYYMRIGNPGGITIHMYSTPSHDIDFCCWGPFEDPVAPCPTGLTAAKVVSCSYSTAAQENCQIPSSAQTGQYYILVITNFSNQSCNISFSKTGGTGTTDCGIMPPLVNNNGPYCVSETITLTGNAQQGATYSWSGPGGWTATGQTVTRPNCTLAMTGDYTCTIHVGSQTNSATTRVQVYAKPTANFTATSVCVGNATQFTNTSTSNPSNQTMNYLWNFGDGQTSTQQHPSHQYASASTYTVTLTASCGQGTCTSTKSQVVNVYASPTANAGPDQTIQYGGTAQLNGSGGAGSFTYHWEPADKVVSPNSASTQTVGLTESTTFTLTVTHPQGGCTSSDEMSVLLEGSNMTASASASPSAICLGESAQLHATAVGGTGNYSYSWSPSVGLSDPLIANPTATPTETTIYTCSVSDGYTTQNVTTTLTVNHPEYEEFDEYICPGDSYTFYGEDYTEEGDYPFVTTTAQGCEKVITLHLHHYPEYPQAHTTTEYICPGTSFPFHGHYYSTDGLYSENLGTIHGCDSIVWLNLTVYPENPTIVDSRSICVGQTLTWFDGNEYSQDGAVAYYDSIDNHGCLQVYQLQLSVGQYQTPQNYTPNRYVCVPHDETPYFHWDIANRDYYQNAKDTIIIPGPAGECDYLYTLDLKFHQEFYQKATVTVCDYYDWPVNGQHYTATNHSIVQPYYGTGGVGFDCDSIYELDLTVNYTDVSERRVLNQCDQYDWQFGWNGETYSLTEQGDYTKTINTHLGCDSIVTLKLQLDYSPDFERVEGNPFVVGGSEFQYTIERYWINTHPSSTHSTEWSLSYKNGDPFTKWDLIPYGDNGDKCYLYIYTFERDTIVLQAHTTSTGDCACGEYTHSKEIICGYYDVPEVTPSFEIDIFPNPNDGNMTIAFDNMTGEVELKVYSITGALIDQLTLHNGLGQQTHTYNPDKLSPGVYFFSFAGQDGLMTKKVIVFD